MVVANEHHGGALGRGGIDDPVSIIFPGEVAQAGWHSPDSMPLYGRS